MGDIRPKRVQNRFPERVQIWRKPADITRIHSAINAEKYNVFGKYAISKFLKGTEHTTNSYFFSNLEKKHFFLDLKKNNIFLNLEKKHFFINLKKYIFFRIWKKVIFFQISTKNSFFTDLKKYFFLKL